MGLDQFRHAVVENEAVATRTTAGLLSLVQKERYVLDVLSSCAASAHFPSPAAMATSSLGPSSLPLSPFFRPFRRNPFLLSSPLPSSRPPGNTSSSKQLA